MKFKAVYMWIFAIFLVLQTSEVHASDEQKCLIKLSFNQAELTNYRQNVKNWKTIWGTTWAIATISQLTLAETIHDHETRKDLWVGAASSALGLIPTWIVPMRSDEAYFFSGDCESELSQSEFLLREFSNEQKELTGPLVHLSNIAVNLATSLVLGLGFGHWGAAAVSLGAGIPIGEVMILTYPKLPNLQDGLHNSPTLTLVPTPSGALFALSLEF